MDPVHVRRLIGRAHLEQQRGGRLDGHVEERVAVAVPLEHILPHPPLQPVMSKQVLLSYLARAYSRTHAPAARARASCAPHRPPPPPRAPASAARPSAHRTAAGSPWQQRRRPRAPGAAGRSRA
eukprot:scaffold16080_cov36-Phaeocystis_antarctica.AAC.1